MQPQMSTIGDLPNELLDEIFAYVHPVINIRPIIPLQTVCRRWNRPFMSQALNNCRTPANIDLQAKFPKLAYFILSQNGKHCKDFNFFKGHAYLQKLTVYHTGLVSSVLNCPRLTSFTFYAYLELFFKDDIPNIFLALLPSLKRLEIKLFTRSREEHTAWVPSHSQKLAEMLQTRPNEQLKLKSLHLSCPDEGLILFYQLFQTTSLDHFATLNKWTTREQVVKFVDYFPKTRSLDIGVTSLVTLTDIVFKDVTSLKLKIHSETEVVTLSSLLHVFPNVKSLDVGTCPVIIDLESTTRLIHSNLALFGPVELRLFKNLKTIEWFIREAEFNYVIQELGNHCPHLTIINISPVKLDGQYETTALELDNVIFPLLVKFSLGGDRVYLNASFSRFLSRHGNLTHLNFYGEIGLAYDWEPIELDQVLWPHLRVLKMCPIYGPDPDIQRKNQMSIWFMKNAPNVTNFKFEFKN